MVVLNIGLWDWSIFKHSQNRQHRIFCDIFMQFLRAAVGRSSAVRRPLAGPVAPVGFSQALLLRGGAYWRLPSASDPRAHTTPAYCAAAAGTCTPGLRTCSYEAEPRLRPARCCFATIRSWHPADCRPWGCGGGGRSGPPAPPRPAPHIGPATSGAHAGGGCPAPRCQAYG